MKTLTFKNIMLLLLLATSINFSFAQSSSKAKATADIKSMVTEQNYVFQAQYANPMAGGNRYLTSEYDFTVSRDSIVAYLPFFGRAFVAPINSDDSGIKFTLTKFDYKLIEKKYGWDIIIKPIDSRKITSINLNISTTGNATLQIISNDRDPISYSGYVVARKQKV